MVEFFKQDEFFKAKSQYRKVLTWFLIILGVYVCASVGVLIWYMTLPYMSKTINSVKAVQYSITVLFVFFAFIYLGIPYKRVKKYYRVMRNMVTGLKETSTGSFFEYDESVLTKDGVECKSVVFLEWNKYKNDFYERKVLVYVEKEFPQFEKNQNVRYVTQGNMLFSYEILE